MRADEDRGTRHGIAGPIALVAVWVVGVFGALAWLSAYRLAPTTDEVVPAWPIESQLAPDPVRPTLVMFAHPRCACTRASLSQLRSLVSSFAGRVATYVVFQQPPGVDGSRADTWTTAASLAGVRVVADRGGREARRFGAETSGQVVLYDAHRRLLWSGGITPARGRVGESPQLHRLARLLERETAGHSGKTPPGRPGAVHGCPLVRGEP